MSADERVLYRGTIEEIEVEFTSDFLLDDTLPVEFTYDREVWMTAEWRGVPGFVRVAAMLVNETNFPPSTTPLYVRVTGDPEAPVVKVGNIRVK